jgi:hypothetical protein
MVQNCQPKADGKQYIEYKTSVASCTTWLRLKTSRLTEIEKIDRKDYDSSSMK